MPLRLRPPQGKQVARGKAKPTLRAFFQPAPQAQRPSSVRASGGEGWGTRRTRDSGSRPPRRAGAGRRIHPKRQNAAFGDPGSKGRPYKGKGKYRFLVVPMENTSGLTRNNTKTVTLRLRSGQASDRPSTQLQRGKQVTNKQKPKKQQIPACGRQASPGQSTAGSE